MAYSPGETAPVSGAYACSICGNVIHMDAGETFPPCANDCKHPRWTLVSSSGGALKVRGA